MHRLWRKRLLVIGFFVGAFIASFASTTYVMAHHDVTGDDCTYDSFTEDTVNGYLYRTVRINCGYNVNAKGVTATSSYNLTRSNLLSYQSLVADQVWMGPCVPNSTSDCGTYNGRWTPFDPCTLTPPNNNVVPGVRDCGWDSLGRNAYAVFQDDATAITFNNDLIHCVSMRDYCNNNGTDIYRTGVQPTAVPAPTTNHDCTWTTAGGTCFNNNGSSFPVIAGAGFFILNNPINLTPAANRSQGFLTDTTVTMSTRNTIGGGYGAGLVLTLRYPRRNSDCTLTNNTVNLGEVQAGTTRTATIRFKNIGRESWRHDWTDTKDPRRTGNGTSTVARETTSYNFAPDQITLPSGNQLITGNTAAAGDPNNGEQISLPISFTAPNTLGSYTVDYRIYIKTSSSSPTHTAIGQTCSITLTVVSYPVGNIECTTTDKTADENTPFSLTLGVRFQPEMGSLPNNASIDVIEDDGLLITKAAGPIVFNGGGSAPPVTSAQHDFNVQAASFDLYNITYTYNADGLSATVTCPVEIKIVKRPYVKLFGNDIFAGGGFGNGCAAGAGDINSNYDQATGRGSGTQFAAFALGDINGFATAIARSSGPLRPSGLSFANTTAPPGNFAANNCVTGFELPSPMPPNNVPGSDITAWPASTAAFYNTGLTEIRAAGPVPNGRRATVYVNGNIKITQNIAYNMASNWNNPADIPAITIIASGDIYIDSSVTQLDGIFVAHGTLYTCYNGPGNSLWNINDLFDNCDTQLTVNGSLVANDIKWLRTFNSMINSNNSEIGNLTNAAEVIISGPEIYAALCSSGPSCSSGNSSTSGTYDAITSLPPIL